MGLVRYSSVPHPIWRKLWTLKVPTKIKIFIWRCLHNAIPCFSVLANRHIGKVSECPICQAGAEDISHVLFKCIRSRAVWDALAISTEIWLAAEVDRLGAAVIDFPTLRCCSSKTFFGRGRTTRINSYNM